MNAEGALDRTGFRDPGATLRLWLVVSLLPFLIKAVSYSLIASYVPLILFCLFASLIGWGLVLKGSRLRLAIVVWSLAMILWGVVRTGLMVLHLIFEIPETHIASQFTAWYLVISFGHIVLGFYLLRYGRKAVPD